jgi:Zn-dependent protease
MLALATASSIVQSLYGVRFKPIATVGGTLLGVDARWLSLRGWGPIVAVGLLAIATAPGEFSLARCAAGASMVAAVILTSLVHESGHALASRIAGLRVQALVIAPQGGVTIHMLSRVRLVNILTSLAGPFANAATGAGCALLMLRIGPDGPLSRLLLEFLVIQFLAAGINLLPFGAMDGGRIFAPSPAA